MNFTATLSNLVFALGLLHVACAEPGAGGEAAIDCGTHGSAHDGHCHCDDGYLFTGETCAAPDAITEICTESDAPEEDGGVAEASTDDGEHHHQACRCPEAAACPCSGELVTIGGVDFCKPELHDE